MASHLHGIDEKLCAICGQANQCAAVIERETGEKQAPCWCTQIKFSDDLLAKVPADKRLKVCVCVSCAKSHA